MIQIVLIWLVYMYPLKSWQYFPISHLFSTESRMIVHCHLLTSPLFWQRIHRSSLLSSRPNHVWECKTPLLQGTLDHQPLLLPQRPLSIGLSLRTAGHQQSKYSFSVVQIPFKERTCPNSEKENRRKELFPL